MEIHVADDTGERFALNPALIEEHLTAHECDLPDRDSENPAHSIEGLIDELTDADAIYCPAGLRVWACAIDDMDQSGWIVGVCRDCHDPVTGVPDYENVHPIVVEGYVEGNTVLPEAQMVNRDDVSALEHATSMLQPILDVANGVLERCAKTAPWSHPEEANR